MLSCVIKGIPCSFSLFVKTSLFSFALPLSVRTVDDESGNFSRMKSFNSIKSFRMSVSDLQGASFVLRCKMIFSGFFSSKIIA